MELTSFNYVLFVALTLVLYRVAYRWGATAQNVVLLAASATFYGLADLRFLGLLVVSALLNHVLAHAIRRASSERRQRLLLRLGVVLDLGLLGYFKYLGFFEAGVAHLLHAIGLAAPHGLLAVALPLGISFYTFQMLGYLIDVHNESTDPNRDPLAFLTYVLFFPKIMAGPIERAQRFLPQLAGPRAFDEALAVDGLRQVLWGLVAKVVIADGAGRFVDLIFAHPAGAAGSTLFMGALLYFIQLYCDFSGYSNLAIGVSKLFGIRLMTNFATPFFATGIADFWRRWHISLSSWMMDHLFTPISFVLRDTGRLGTVVAISVTFLAVGLWHGANWTFVAFGVLQSLYFLPLALSSSITRAGAAHHTALLPSPGHFARMAGMFLLMMLSFVLLRSADIHQALTFYRGLASPSLFSRPRVFPTNTMVFAALFIAVEWTQRGHAHALMGLAGSRSAVLRWAIYLGLLFVLFLFADTGTYQFIYFQF